MSDRRRVWATLAELLTRLERDIEHLATGETAAPTKTAASTKPAAPTKTAASQSPEAQLSTLEQEIRKLGKTQYKANMLAERQTQRVEQTLENLAGQQEQQEALVERIVAERVTAARDTWLASILPTLDGLDHAIENGRRYLARRDQAAKHPNLSEAQRALVSPADRTMLASWLEGLRLVRERLLALLKSQGVTPIPTVGQPFDPYQHVAVATTAEGADRPGTIVAEERRGYRTENHVLRYADVVVYRPEKIPEP